MAVSAAGSIEARHPLDDTDYEMVLDANGTTSTVSIFDGMVTARPPSPPRSPTPQPIELPVPQSTGVSTGAPCDVKPDATSVGSNKPAELQAATASTAATTANPTGFTPFTYMVRFTAGVATTVLFTVLTGFAVQARQPFHQQPSPLLLPLAILGIAVGVLGVVDTVVQGVHKSATTPDQSKAKED